MFPRGGNATQENAKGHDAARNTDNTKQNRATQDKATQGNTTQNNTTQHKTTQDSKKKREDKPENKTKALRVRAQMGDEMSNCDGREVW